MTDFIDHLPASLAYALEGLKYHAGITSETLNLLGEAAQKSNATDDDAAVEARRQEASDWLIRTYAARLLYAAGLPQEANRLREMKLPFSFDDLIQILDRVRSAREAAGNSPSIIDATWDASVYTEAARLDEAITTIAGGDERNTPEARVVYAASKIGDEAGELAIIRNREAAFSAFGRAPEVGDGSGRQHAGAESVVDKRNAPPYPAHNQVGRGVLCGGPSRGTAATPS